MSAFLKCICMSKAKLYISLKEHTVEKNNKKVCDTHSHTYIYKIYKLLAKTKTTYAVWRPLFIATKKPKPKSQKQKYKKYEY